MPEVIIFNFLFAYLDDQRGAVAERVDAQVQSGLGKGLPGLGKGLPGLGKGLPGLRRVPPGALPAQFALARATSV